MYVQIMVVDCSLWAESDSYFFVTCSNQPIFCESQLLFTICFSKHSKLFTVFSELVFVVVVSSERNFDSDKFSIFKNGANKIPPLLDKQILSGKRYRTFPAPKFFYFFFFSQKRITQFLSLLLATAYKLQRLAPTAACSSVYLKNIFIGLEYVAAAASL